MRTSLDFIAEETRRSRLGLPTDSELLRIDRLNREILEKAAHTNDILKLNAGIPASAGFNSALALTQIARELVAPYSAVIGLGEKLFMQSSDLTQQAIKAVDPFFRMLAALDAIPKPELKLFETLFTSYSDALWHQLDDTERKVFRVFEKLGLVGLQAHLTRGELLRVNRVYRKSGRKAVLKFIFARFRKAKYRNLNRLTRRWWTVPYMAKRKKAIRAALKAHKEGAFELSIPTLLPFVDGLAAEIVPRLPKPGKGPIHVNEVAQMHHDGCAELSSECILAVVNNLIYRRVDFKKLKRPPSSINRHAILHGRVIDYASELNSYRVIFLLDTMVGIYATKPLPTPARTAKKP